MAEQASTKYDGGAGVQDAHPSGTRHCCHPAALIWDQSACRGCPYVTGRRFRRHWNLLEGRCPPAAWPQRQVTALSFTEDAARAALAASTPPWITCAASNETCGHFARGPTAPCGRWHGTRDSVCTSRNTRCTSTTVYTVTVGCAPQHMRRLCGPELAKLGSGGGGEMQRG